MRNLIQTDKFLHYPEGTDGYLFDQVAGVQVRADIKRPFDTFGVSVRHVGPVRPVMLETLDAWMTEFRRLTHQDVSALVLCSVWREAKPGEVFNRHAEGLAADIGGLWFSRLKGVTAWGYARDRDKAIGLEASLRMYFGTVLGPTSNAAHANHWHVDIGKDVELTADELETSRRVRKVEVVFLQEMLVSLWGFRGLKIDGHWGPRTEAATKAALAELGHSDITDRSAYRAMLRAGVYVGFGVIESGELSG